MDKNNLQEKALFFIKEKYKKTLTTEIKKGIAKGLGQLGGKEAMDMLETMYKETGSSDLQALIMEAICSAARFPSQT